MRGRPANSDLYMLGALGPHHGKRFARGAVTSEVLAILLYRFGVGDDHAGRQCATQFINSDHADGYLSDVFFFGVTQR
jgi:hypothetical protein